MGASPGLNFTPYSVPNAAKMSASGKQVSFKAKGNNNLPTDFSGMDYLKRNNNGRTSPLRNKSPRRFDVGYEG